MSGEVRQSGSRRMPIAATAKLGTLDFTIGTDNISDS
jgi:hypothetical protein